MISSMSVRSAMLGTWLHGQCVMPVFRNEANEHT